MSLKLEAVEFRFETVEFRLEAVEFRPDMVRHAEVRQQRTVWVWLDLVWVWRAEARQQWMI